MATHMAQPAQRDVAATEQFPPWLDDVLKLETATPESDARALLVKLGAPADRRVGTALRACRPTRTSRRTVHGRARSAPRRAGAPTRGDPDDGESDPEPF